MSLTPGHARGALDPAERRPLPPAVRLFMVADVGIALLVLGLVLVAHAVGLGSDSTDRTAAHFVWGGVTSTSGVLLLCYVTVRVALRR